MAESVSKIEKDSIIDQLLCVSPIDGRYRTHTRCLSEYFSEYALYKYRVYVEIEYLCALIKLLKKNVNIDYIKNIYKNFNERECEHIKKIEFQINHDVKSVEYYIREKLEDCDNINTNDESFSNLIHFGLTSQDINSCAINLSIKIFIQNNFSEIVSQFTGILEEKILKWNKVIMLSRTHGQPAVPTTLGKEMQVFNKRFDFQFDELKKIKFHGKFGGAIGNLNAHRLAYPSIDWVQFCNIFLESMGLIRSSYTTQVENYEHLSSVFDCLKRMNLVLIDLCRDIWHYISIDYFTQTYKKAEVGSSTMPHKINPISFENAEGNFMLANSLLEFLSSKLPISRLQRDLTDSTVTRNFGTVFGYMIIAYQSLIKGLYTIEYNAETIKEDLLKNQIVITEGLQTILRKYGDTQAYEKLKIFSRNNENINLEDIHNFIQGLDIQNHIKEELMKVRIETYCGYTE